MIQIILYVDLITTLKCSLSCECLLVQMDSNVLETKGQIFNSVIYIVVPRRKDFLFYGSFYRWLHFQFYRRGTK